MDYATPLWSGCKPSVANKLLSIQHKALQVASGAFRNTSGVALEVDCHIQPLRLRWHALSLTWYAKIVRLSEQHPLRQQVLQLIKTAPNFPWRGSFLQRVKFADTFGDFSPGVSALQVHAEPLPLPHQQLMNLVQFHGALLMADHCPKPAVPRTDQGMQMARTWVEQKLHCLRSVTHSPAIYWTDGSCETPGGLAGAGIFVDHVLDGPVDLAVASRTLSIPVSRHGNIHTAEVWAIVQAATHFMQAGLHLVSHSSLHIWTDSEYAVKAIFGDLKPNNTTSLDSVNKLLCLFHIILSSGCSITVHWIPGHCGIGGNETLIVLQNKHLLTFLLLPKTKHRAFPLAQWSALSRKQLCNNGNICGITARMVDISTLSSLVSGR